jgi:hypothetical protein
MILQLFIFGFLFLVLGLFFYFKKKKILGYMFVLLAIFAVAIGLIVVNLFPHTLPF